MKQTFAAAALALGLLSHPGSAQEPSAPQQKSAIPDAPAPQGPALGDIAPGKGTTATSNGDSTSKAPEPGQPGTSLPSTPAAEPGNTPAQAPLADSDPGPAPISDGSQLQTLVLRSRFVDVPFTVKDSKGNLVPGLTWRDVRVYENNVRMQPAIFTVDPIPLSVALVIDQTLPTDAMTRVNNALGALQGAFAPYDSVAVFTYTNQVKEQTDFTGGQSPRLAAVVERSKVDGRQTMFYDSGPLSNGININDGAMSHVNPLTSGGPGSTQGVQQVQREGHPLNDAILAAAKATTEAGPDRRRIVYVISDGKEYGSAAKEKDVIKYCQANKVAVYATIVGDSSVAGMGFVDRVHIPLFMHDNVLPRYTGATGGQAYAEFRTPAIEKSFARITEQVRTQYTIGYYSREPALDGKFRKLEIKVLRPNLTVIAKDGYYPQAAPIRPRPVASADKKPAAPTP